MPDTASWILIGCLIIDALALAFLVAYWPRDPWEW